MLHRILRRSIAELGARNPLPISPSLSVNSIPVVGPLADSLVGNGQPSPSPDPQSAVKSTSGSGNSGGNGNGKGEGNGGGNNPSPTSPPASGGGTAAPQASGNAPGPTPPGPAPGESSSSSNLNYASGGNSPASPSGPGATGNSPSPGGGQTSLVNVGSGPSVNSVAFGASPPAATGIPSSSPDSLDLSSGTVSVAAPSSTISTVAAVSSGKRLSGGAIAGIIIVCFVFLLVLILLVVRRRSITRRLELRRQWWSNHNTNTSFVNRRNPRGPARLNGQASSRESTRSSFATNFDQGLMFRIDTPSGFSPGLIPDHPPMAEVRERNSVLIPTGGSVARRESMNSMMSNGSEPGAQYLTVSRDQNNLEPSSPMSVHPFSPSESFAFPKPPAPPSFSVGSSLIPKNPGFGSTGPFTTTLIPLSTLPRALMSDPSLAPVSKHPYAQTSTPSVPFPPFTATTNPSMDCFTDPAKPGFLNTEVIRRPFTPSLDDELAVGIGNRVRIFHVFDDGWAFVEKLAATGGERHERGLIPVDCFRQVDQALTTFLTEKRVSYGSVKLIGHAL